MENGEKGKPLRHGISNMIRENELFRKSLNDFISESDSYVRFKRPDIQFDVRNKSTLIKSDLKLTDYFKVMYNNYYIKLGDE